MGRSGPDARHILNKSITLKRFTAYLSGVENTPEGAADFLADLLVLSLCRWVLQIDQILCACLLSSLLVGILKNVWWVLQMLTHLGLCLERGVVSSLV